MSLHPFINGGRLHTLYHRTSSFWTTTSLDNHTSERFADLGRQRIFSNKLRAACEAWHPNRGKGDFWGTLKRYKPLVFLGNLTLEFGISLIIPIQKREIQSITWVPPKHCNSGFFDISTMLPAIPAILITSSA